MDAAVASFPKSKEQGSLNLGNLRHLFPKLYPRLRANYSLLWIRYQHSHPKAYLYDRKVEIRIMITMLCYIHWVSSNHRNSTVMRPASLTIPFSHTQESFETFLGPCGPVVAHWTRASRDRYCSEVRFMKKKTSNHLISSNCPRPNSVFIVLKKSSLKHFISLCPSIPDYVTFRL